LLARYDSADWDKVMDINLKGNFLLTKALLPTMIQQSWGRIIHVASVVALKGEKGTAAYSASKSGLLGLSRVMAKEYARFNITSNVLNLGYFEVGLIETVSKDKRKEIIESIPSKKLGQASSIINALKFLIHSDYVNGSVLTIDGGL